MATGRSRLLSTAEQGIPGRGHYDWASLHRAACAFYHICGKRPASRDKVLLERDMNVQSKEKDVLYSASGAS